VYFLTPFHVRIEYNIWEKKVGNASFPPHYTTAQWRTQEFSTGGAYPGFHEVAASGGSRKGQSGHGLWPPSDEEKIYCSIYVPDFLIILRNYYLKQENVSFRGQFF